MGFYGSTALWWRVATRFQHCQATHLEKGHCMDDGFNRNSLYAQSVHLNCPFFLVSLRFQVFSGQKECVLMDALAVTSSHRKMGIGHALIQSAVRFASVKNLHLSLLVECCNLAAVKLYQRQHFVRSHWQADFYPTSMHCSDVLVMQYRPPVTQNVGTAVDSDVTICMGSKLVHDSNQSVAPGTVNPKSESSAHFPLSPNSSPQTTKAKPFSGHKHA